MKARLALTPDDTHRVQIAEEGVGAVTVTNVTLTKTTVALGEAFEAHVFVSNTTGGTVSKEIAAFFGNYNPETGELLDYWGLGGSGDIPVGDSEWIINCTGNVVGVWDVLGCVGTVSDSNFTPDPNGCAYRLDYLTVT